MNLKISYPLFSEPSPPIVSINSKFVKIKCDDIFALAFNVLMMEIVQTGGCLKIIMNFRLH
jgi:hypothetical protein